MSAGPVSDAVPYRVIAEQFRRSGIILFLGAGASVAGASGNALLPTGRDLSELLRKAVDYPGREGDSLSKVAQYYEIQADRNILLDKVVEIFAAAGKSGGSGAAHDAGASTIDCAPSICQFLARLPGELRPKLIVTTNYDMLVEQALTPGEYLSISQIRRGKSKGQFLCSSDHTGPVNRDQEVLTNKALDARLETFRSQQPNAVIVYKMHGTARMLVSNHVRLDSIVLTENDYVDFLATQQLMKLPSLILDDLLTKRLLFLGYSLQDWNFRVLLRRIREIQAGRNVTSDEARKHWAILRTPDQVESRFWGTQKVDLYDVSLEAFFDRMASELAAPQ